MAEMPESLCWGSTLVSLFCCTRLDTQVNLGASHTSFWNGNNSSLSLFFTFFPIFCHAACGILVPQPGIEPVPPTVEVRCLNHWTAREVPLLSSLAQWFHSHVFFFLWFFKYFLWLNIFNISTSQKLLTEIIWTGSELSSSLFAQNGLIQYTNPSSGALS